MSIPPKVIYRLAFERKSVSRNVRINTISLVFGSPFHRQNVTPLGPSHKQNFEWFFKHQIEVPFMPTSGKQTSVPNGRNGRLKITLPNLTYPKAWTGSVPLCPLIFSWTNAISHSHDVSSLACVRRSANGVSIFRNQEEQNRPAFQEFFDQRFGCLNTKPLTK